ncbi:MAG: sigma 54-interacting transcriptional regulator, partial [Gemmatimonadetes bacterium]|nr:sigma 54-interacting transcriptional regulator [Gemmatimonadota bacterium]
FKRVGGTEDIEVQLRIIAATHQDLQKAVAERRFRQDLFFRLNVVPIYIPPLRERPEDIPILASYFIDFFNRELGRNIRGLSPTARKRLQNYVWPGNVRELRNVLERAILLEDEDRILLHEIPIDMPHDMMPMMQQSEREGDFVPITLRELELQAVRQTLAWARGNKTKAAKALGISRQTLREKVRRLDEGALASTPN